MTLDSRVGGDAAESGNGPGSYPVDGNIFHFDCCNPEDKVNGGPWMLFGSFGWSNNGSSQSHHLHLTDYEMKFPPSLYGLYIYCLLVGSGCGYPQNDDKKGFEISPSQRRNKLNLVYVGKTCAFATMDGCSTEGASWLNFKSPYM